MLQFNLTCLWHWCRKEMHCRWTGRSPRMAYCVTF